MPDTAAHRLLGSGTLVIVMLIGIYVLSPVARVLAPMKSTVWPCCKKTLRENSVPLLSMSLSISGSAMLLVTTKNFWFESRDDAIASIE